MSISQEYMLQLRPEQGLVHKAALTGLIQNREDRQEAIRLIRQGRAVGMFVRGVCVIWIDGANPEAVETIRRIKGERRKGQAMATALAMETLVDLVNSKEIPDALKYVLMNPAEVEMRLGTCCLLRFPIRQEAAAQLPSALVSHSADGLYWLQSWLPGGEGGAREMPAQKFIKEMREQGVCFPGVTSMNASGEPEIVEQSEAEAFCAAHAIPLFLSDPEAGKRVQGSFPILQVDRNGYHLVREGHFDGGLFQRLLNGTAIDRSRTQAGKFPIVHTTIPAGITSPYELHDALVRFLDGTGD